MKYEVFWAHSAVEELFRAGAQDRRLPLRILIAVKGFGRDASGDVKKLEGQSNQWRLRVGDWRIIFLRTQGTMTVTRIANRRDAY